jgi:hypothetical protein
MPMARNRRVTTVPLGAIDLPSEWRVRVEQIWTISTSGMDRIDAECCVSDSKNRWVGSSTPDQIKRCGHSLASNHIVTSNH